MTELEKGIVIGAGVVLLAVCLYCDVIKFARRAYDEGVTAGYASAYVKRTMHGHDGSPA
jgi:hypothetical protein